MTADISESHRVPPQLRKNSRKKKPAKSMIFSLPPTQCHVRFRSRVSQESQPKRVPRLLKSDCPACRNQHRAHMRVGFCRLARREDGQRQNAQHQREQSDTNGPAPVEASHRKRQAHPNSSQKKQQLKQAKKNMSWFFPMRFLLFTMLSIACIFDYG